MKFVIFGFAALVSFSNMAVEVEYKHKLLSDGNAEDFMDYVHGQNEGDDLSDACYSKSRAESYEHVIDHLNEFVSEGHYWSFVDEEDGGIGMSLYDEQNEEVVFGYLTIFDCLSF